MDIIALFCFVLFVYFVCLFVCLFVLFCFVFLFVAVVVIVFVLVFWFVCLFVCFCFCFVFHCVVTCVNGNSEFTKGNVVRIIHEYVLHICCTNWKSFSRYVGEML